MGRCLLKHGMNMAEEEQVQYGETQPLPAMPPESDPTPSVLAENYHFLRQIGEGAQGKVYQAERRSDGKIVAIKMLQIHSLHAWKEYELFQRESRVLSTLKLPGVAAFYESVEALDGDMPAAYIVQEWIEGRSLARMLMDGYRFTLSQIFQIASKLIELIAQLHHHDPPVIHRDIKPSNILVKENADETFSGFLIDFGAVANPQVQGGGSTVAGTYGYMPPEQMTGNPCPESDIYALAATLVRLLSGVEPGCMQVSDFRIVIDPHLQTVPRSVVRVLQKMLEPFRDKRLCDYDVLKKLFDAFLQGDFGIVNRPEFIGLLGTEDSAYRDCGVWNEALRKVIRHGQPGNLELWMRLPEETPRKDLPECYKPLPHLTWQELMKKRLYFIDFYKAEKAFQPFKWVMGCLFILVIILGFIIIALDGYDVFGKIAGIVLLIMGALAVSLAIFVLYALLVLIFGRNAVSFKEVNPNLKNLIRNGKKCMATVESIEYLPHEDIFLQSIWDNELVERGMAYKCVVQPYFKIRYVFSLPIGEKVYTVHHEVRTHFDVRNGLHPGDAFPLLTHIQVIRYDKSAVFVHSMPFPIAFPDTDHFYNIYCNTRVAL